MKNNYAGFLIANFEAFCQDNNFSKALISANVSHYCRFKSNYFFFVRPLNQIFTRPWLNHTSIKNFKKFKKGTYTPYSSKKTVHASKKEVYVQLNALVQRSKIFHIFSLENPKLLFPFFVSCYFIFTPGLCQHRPGHSFGEKIMLHEMKNKKTTCIF